VNLGIGDVGDAGPATERGADAAFGSPPCLVVLAGVAGPEPDPDGQHGPDDRCRAARRVADTRTIRLGVTGGDAQPVYQGRSEDCGRVPG